MRMKVLIREKLSENKMLTPEGYLICVDSVLARTGKQSYTRDEVYNDSSFETVEIDRTSDEVFSDAAIASFENKPITIEHPKEQVNANNNRRYSVGFVRDVKRGKDAGKDVLLGSLVITDKDAIDDVQSGKRTDLSCGYDCDITDDDKPRQINIRGNHVALCVSGRAGNARIVDTDTQLVDEKVVYVNNKTKIVQVGRSGGTYAEKGDSDVWWIKRQGKVIKYVNSDEEAFDYVKAANDLGDSTMNDSNKDSEISSNRDFDFGYRDGKSGYYDKWYRYNRNDNGAEYERGIKLAIKEGATIKNYISGSGNDSRTVDSDWVAGFKLPDGSTKNEMFEAYDKNRAREWAENLAKRNGWKFVALQTYRESVGDSMNIYMVRLNADKWPANEVGHVIHVRAESANEAKSKAERYYDENYKIAERMKSRKEYKGQPKFRAVEAREEHDADKKDVLIIDNDDRKQYLDVDSTDLNDYDYDIDKLIKNNYTGKRTKRGADIFYIEGMYTINPNISSRRYRSIAELEKGEDEYFKEISRRDSKNFDDSYKRYEVSKEIDGNTHVYIVHARSLQDAINKVTRVLNSNRTNDTKQYVVKIGLENAGTYVFLGNSGRSWVQKASVHMDVFNTREEAEAARKKQAAKYKAEVHEIEF